MSDFRDCSLLPLAILTEGKVKYSNLTELSVMFPFLLRTCICKLSRSSSMLLIDQQKYTPLSPYFQNAFICFEACEDKIIGVGTNNGS